MRVFFSGAKESRTPDLLHAMQALYQLSYNPEDAHKYRMNCCACQEYLEKKLLKFFDRHGFDNHVVIGAVHAVGLDAGDFVEHVEAFVELAEHRVAVSRARAALVVVEEVHVVAVDDEELAADAVRHGCLCPAEGTAHVGEAAVVLVADSRTRSLGCVAAGAVSAGEVATLDHEVLDDAVERGSVVLALLCKFNEVRGAFADEFFEKAEFHRAVVGFHDGDGFACLRFVELIKGHFGSMG